MTTDGSKPVTIEASLREWVDRTRQAYAKAREFEDQANRLRIRLGLALGLMTDAQLAELARLESRELVDLGQPVE